MGKTLYILFVCGAGLGSSFAAQMAAEDVLAKYHINAKLDHVDISTAASVQPEVIITAQNFQKQYDIIQISTGNKKRPPRHFPPLIIPL